MKEILLILFFFSNVLSQTCSVTAPDVLGPYYQPNGKKILNNLLAPR
jgi:hypothetical protein